MERLLYGRSTLTCLPIDMADQPSAASGAVIRADTLRAHARNTGLRDIKVLPIEHDFPREYRLVL